MGFVIMVRQRRNNKIKNEKYPFLNPLFHHSTIPLFHCFIIEEKFKNKKYNIF